MTPKTVWAVYFSGTGTTERTVRSVAGELARMLSVPCRSFDFTRPQARQKELSFCEREKISCRKRPKRSFRQLFCFLLYSR